MVGDSIYLIRSSRMNRHHQWGTNHARMLRIFRVSRVEGERDLDEALGR